MFFFTVLFTLIVNQANARDAITLSELKQMTEQTPKMRSALSQTASAESRALGTSALFLPNLSVFGTRLLDKKYVYTDVALGAATPVSIPGIIPDTVYGLQSQWVIFDGFSSIDRYRAAQLEHDAARNDKNIIRLQSERDLILGFYRVLAAQTLKEVAEQNLKALKDHLSDSRLFRQAGVTTNYDVLRVEVQTSEAQSEVLNSVDTLQASRLRLNEIVGIEDFISEKTTISGEFPSLSSAIVNGITYKQEDRDDLKALKDRTLAASYLAHSAQAHWFPRISLNGQYSRYNNKNTSITDNDSYRDAYTLSIQMQWSLFDGFASNAKEIEEREHQKQAEILQVRTEIRAKSDFEIWKRKFLYFSTVAKARSSDIEKSQESVRLAKEGRKAGTRTNTDLLDAEAELFRARAGLVNSQLGAIEALINLELATGRQIYKFE